MRKLAIYATDDEYIRIAPIMCQDIETHEPTKEVAFIKIFPNRYGEHININVDYIIPLRDMLDKIIDDHSIKEK